MNFFLLSKHLHVVNSTNTLKFINKMRWSVWHSVACVCFDTVEILANSDNSA